MYVYCSIVTLVHPSMESYGLDIAVNARLTCSYSANLDMLGCLSFTSKGLKNSAASRGEQCMI